MSVADHRIGDRYVAELADPALTLVVSFNAYQRWTVVIIDRKTNSHVLDLHEEYTLDRAQRYAEGYVQGTCGMAIAPDRWIAQRI